jgi:hypothetical protein
MVSLLFNFERNPYLAVKIAGAAVNGTVCCSDVTSQSLFDDLILSNKWCERCRKDAENVKKDLQNLKESYII